jgi:hypothetical protein
MKSRGENDWYNQQVEMSENEKKLNKIIEEHEDI